jgi:hypothetical protein
MAADPLFVGSATLVAVTVTVCAVEIVAGAVYTPVDETEPTDGATDHTTAVLVVPETAAARLCDCDGVILELGGETSTLIAGTREIVAVADFVGSATLVAVTVTVCALDIVAGAVYTPLDETEPADGERVHVTLPFVVPDTLAATDTLCNAPTELLDGVTATLTTGTSAIVADALFVGSAELTAVTVTDCAADRVAGAV